MLSNKGIHALLSTKLGPNAVQELKINQRRILIDSLEIGIPAPEQMIALGERQLPNGVKVGQLLNSKTLNYKKFTPHRDGLFCERIFGPVQSFVCACGKKKESVQSKSKQKDIVKTKFLIPSAEVGEAEMIPSFQREVLFCPKCQVEYISKNVRRHRLGYIKLFAPVTHIWYLKGRPSYLSLFLGKRKKAITSLAYCNAYLVEQVYSNSEAKNIVKDTDKSVSPLIENSNIKVWQKFKLKQRGEKGEEAQIRRDRQDFFSVHSLPSPPNIRSNTKITNQNDLYKTQKDVTNQINLNHSGGKPFLSLLEQLFDGSESYALNDVALRCIPYRCYKNKVFVTPVYRRSGMHQLNKNEVFVTSFGKETYTKRLPFTSKGGQVKEQSINLNRVSNFKTEVVEQDLQRCDHIFNQSFALSPATLSLNKRYTGLIQVYLLTKRYKSVTKLGSWLELLPKRSLGMHKMNNKARRHYLPAPFVNRPNGDAKTKLYQNEVMPKLVTKTEPKQSFGYKSLLSFCNPNARLSSKLQAVNYLSESTLQTVYQRSRSETAALSKSQGNFSLSSYIRAQTLPFLPSLICSFHLRDCLISFLQSSPCTEDIPIPSYCQTPRRYPLRDVHKFLTEFRSTETSSQTEKLTSESIIELTGLPKKVKPFLKAYSETLPEQTSAYKAKTLFDASPSLCLNLSSLDFHKNSSVQTEVSVFFNDFNKGYRYNVVTKVRHINLLYQKKRDVLRYRVSAKEHKINGKDIVLVSTSLLPSTNTFSTYIRKPNVMAKVHDRGNTFTKLKVTTLSVNLGSVNRISVKNTEQKLISRHSRNITARSANKASALVGLSDQSYRSEPPHRLSKVVTKTEPKLNKNLTKTLFLLQLFVTSLGYKLMHTRSKIYRCYKNKVFVTPVRYATQRNVIQRKDGVPYNRNILSENNSLSQSLIIQSKKFAKEKVLIDANTRARTGLFTKSKLTKQSLDCLMPAQLLARKTRMSLPYLRSDTASLVQFPVTKLNLWSIFGIPKILCRLSPLKHKDRLGLTLGSAKTPLLQGIPDFRSGMPCNKERLSGKISTYQTRLLHFVFGNLPQDINLNQSIEFKEQTKFHKADLPENTFVVKHHIPDSGVFLPSCTTKTFNNPPFFQNPMGRSPGLNGEHFWLRQSLNQRSSSAHLSELKLMAGLYSNQDRGILQYRKINFRIYSSHSRPFLVKQVEKGEKGVTLSSRSRLSFVRSIDPDGLFNVSFSINLPYFISGSKQNTICLITKKEKQVEWTIARKDLSVRSAGKDVVSGNKNYDQAKALFNKVTCSVASTAFVSDSLPDSNVCNCILVKQFEINESSNSNHSFVYTSGPLTKLWFEQIYASQVRTNVHKLYSSQTFKQPVPVTKRNFVYKAKTLGEGKSIQKLNKNEVLVTTFCNTDKDTNSFPESASRSQDSALFKAYQVKDPVTPSETSAPISESEGFTQTISKWHINGAKEILLYTGGGALESLLKRFNISLFCQFLFGEIQTLRKYYKDQIAAEYNKNKIVVEHSLDSFAINQLDSQILNQYTPPRKKKVNLISTSYVSENNRHLMTEQNYQSEAYTLQDELAVKAATQAIPKLVTKTEFLLSLGKPGYVQDPYEVGLEQSSKRAVTALLDKGYKSSFLYKKERHFGLKHVVTDKNANLFCRRIYRTTRRLKIVQLLMRSKRRPEWMMISVLPVLPPDLRPVLQMGENLIVASDLNTLYQRVIYRNNRHYKGRFLDFHFVSSIHRLVQDAVDRLIENGKGGSTPFLTPGGRPLKSLSDILKGKRGRFRFNLLGKRVDFSGRSVIVVSPNLKIHECGLPREMALELYKYLLIRQLLLQKRVSSIVNAKKVIKQRRSFIWDILREIIYYHPLLLNRAPTLHRLGIQAFQPKLALGNAILLHPLVCAGFNADFDGDQMGVHLPLSPQARAETWDLLWSRNNLLSPATGQPILLPSQDMVLGFYYMTALLPYGTTFRLPSEDGQTKATHKNKIDLPVIYVFSDTFQVVHAYQKKQIDIHTPIWLKWVGQSENGEKSQVPLELRIDMFGYRTQIYPTHKSKNKVCKDLNTSFLTLSKNEGLNKTLPYRLQTLKKNEVFVTSLLAKTKLYNLQNEVNALPELPKQVLVRSSGKTTEIVRQSISEAPVSQRFGTLNNQDIVSGNEYIRTTVGRVLVNNLISKNS